MQRLSHRLAFALLVACGWLAVAPLAGAARFDFDTAGGRLPKDVRPSHYRLLLDVDPALDRFAGTVDIDIDVRRPVEAVVLNAHGLEASVARLIDAAGAERVLAVTADAALQQWRLGAGTRIDAGRYRLRIDYRGSVQRVGQGLFVVDYHAQGAAAKMLATQLEPGHARKVFPGFDEPAFRARFELTARAPERYEVVSNMPATGSRVAEGKRETAFAATPAMPAYLFAIAVGEFDVLADHQDGVDLRILTARGKREHARFAMDATKELLRYFADYFGQAYMLPKLDQLAIPGTRWGAMEDWGAISYNEGVLLYDPQRSSPSTKARVYGIVAHEIAHQWFGNLVTAAWWDDIWLNEAFATWMAAKASHHFNPTWGVKARARQSKEDAMSTDAGSATRPIVIPVRTEAEAFSVFDEITYDKGGAVLTMFEDAIGPDAFRDGLRRYMREHAYSNATADDLWHHLSAAAGRDLTVQIAAWVGQPGFPLLDVATRCRDGRTEVRLAQQRFTSTSMRELAAMWQVPVTLRSGVKTKALTLGREPATVAFDGCAPVVVNAGDTGYYRVRYDKDGMARLRRGFGALAPLDRAAITADTYALVRRGAVPAADYLALLALPAPRTPSEWLVIMDSLDWFDEALEGTPAQAAFRAWGRTQLAPQLEALGWTDAPGDPLPVLRLRGALVDALGRFDHAPTIEQARRLHTDGGASQSTLTAVAHTVARHADEPAFEALRAARKAATGQEERHRLERALTLLRDPALVARAQAIALTDEWEPGAASYFATQVGREGGNAALAFAFVEKHYATLAAKTSDGGRLYLLPNAAGGFNDRASIDTLMAAQQARVGDAGLVPARRVAEQIREKAEVREREGQRLAAQLRTSEKRSQR